MKVPRATCVLICLLAACAANDDEGVICFTLARDAWDQPPEIQLRNKPGDTLRLFMRPVPRREFSAADVPPIPESATLAIVGGDSAAWWNPTPDSLVVVAGELAGFTIRLQNQSGRRRAGTVQTFTDLLDADSSGAVRYRRSTAALSATRISCNR